MFAFSLTFMQAQAKYMEGSFKVQIVDEDFFDTKILTDSGRNKEVIAENMTYYNKMIKAYNAKDYKEAQKWAEEAFLGSIAEKIQFKVYQNKFEYAHDLMENQKLILFISLCKIEAKIDYIQDVYDYCKKALSEDRMSFINKFAEQYNSSAKKKIVTLKTYSYE